MINTWSYMSAYVLIFTFSKQAFDESLGFYSRSKPHERYKYDWQLPRSLSCAIHFNINLFARSGPVDVIDSEPQLIGTCKTSLLFAS